MKVARIGRKLAPVAGSWSLRLLAATLRLRREEKAVEPLLAAGAAVIYIAWHSRLLLLPYLYRHRGLRVLISRSEDGAMIAGLVRRFGFVTVRGSSSRGERRGSGLSPAPSGRVTASSSCRTARGVLEKCSSRVSWCWHG